jgi:hypothetical protein
MAETTFLTSLALDAPTMDRIYAVLERQRKQNRTLSRADILRQVITAGLASLESGPVAKNGAKR